MAAKHSSDEIESTGVEAADLEAAGAAVPRHGFFVRLYTGTGAFEVVGRRKFWFSVSGLIVAVAIASIVLRGFTLGIDFEARYTSGQVTRNTTTTSRIVVRPSVNAKPLTCPMARK